MAKFWTLIKIMLISFVIVNAQNYNYGHGNYYNPLVPQRSNVQHFHVVQVHSQPINQHFVPQNQQYSPAATNVFPQQRAANPNQLIKEQVFRGDYISQSESAQLDQSVYPYKQRFPGDNRPFKRFVTTCYPGGRCENQSHDVNSVDKSHQDLLQQFRAQIQYEANKQEVQGAYNGSASQNAFSLVAPRGNREYLPPAGAHQAPALCQYQVYQPQQSQQVFSTYQNTNPGNFAQSSQQSAQFATNSFERPPERRLYPYYEAVSSISFN